MKKSFHKLSLKSLWTTINRITPDNEELLVLLEKDVALLWALLCRLFYLRLIADNRDLINVEKKPSLPIVYREFEAGLRELKIENLKLSAPDAAMVLIGSRAISIATARTSSPNSRAVMVDDLIKRATVVSNYNFASTFQDKFPEMFAEAEKVMAEVARSNSWAARGSWNAFVDRSESKRPKKDKDLSFLDQFQSDSKDSENTDRKDQNGDAEKDQAPLQG